jgi:general transcription factor IIIA
MCDVDDCGRTFTKKGNLVVHTRTVHENVKQFVCGDADLSGSKKLIYDNGEAVEWDQVGCGRAFTAKATLENHIRTHHLGLERWDHVVERKHGHGPAEKKGKRSLGGGNWKAKPIAASSLLTGHGYEDSGRDIACVAKGCENKFYRDYDMRLHCSSAHGLAEVEIEELFREREAREGGAFWYGGVVPPHERGFAEYEEDDELFDAELLRFESMGLDSGLDVGFLVDPQLESMEMVAAYVRGVEDADLAM